MDESIKIPIIIEGDKAFIFLNDFEKAAKKTGTTVRALGDPLRSTANAGFAFNQILREAPSFAYSFQMGIMGISNNLPIFTDAMKRAREAGASKTQIMKDLGRQMLSLPSIMSFASLAIVVLGDKLFGTNQTFSQATLVAAQFNSVLEQIGKSADNLKDKLDFGNKLAKLRAEMSGVKGEDLNIVDLSNQIFSAQEIIGDASRNIKGLEKWKQFIGGFAEEEKKLGLAIESMSGKMPKLAKLLNTYSDPTQIPESLIGKLKNKEQEQLNAYIKVLKTLESEKKRSADAQGVIEANQIQIEIERNNKLERLRKEDVAAYEKYVNEIIARAKKVESVFKGAISISPGFKIFDTLQQEFSKAQSFLDKFDAFKFTWTIAPKLDMNNIDVPPEEVKPKAREWSEIFAKEWNDYWNTNNPTDFSLINIHEKELEKLEKMKQKLAEFRPLAEGIGDAFASTFQEIANGGNAIKAAGEAVKALVIDLITAAIKAFVVKKLLSFMVPGSGGFLPNSFNFSIPKLAAGGIIGGATLGVMGEGMGTSKMNPEIISPLDQLQSFFGGMLNDVMSGTSGGSQIQGIGTELMIPKTVKLEFDGDDLVGTMTVVQKRQSRGG